MPEGQKTAMKYLSNTMHVLPNHRMPVQQVPLDIFVSNKRAFIAKEGDEYLVDNQTLTVDEYDFPHSICILNNGVSASSLEIAYNTCFKHLGDNIDLSNGVMILASPKWLFVTPVVGPYSIYKQLPMYLDGYAYAGIVSFQRVVPEWPATAGLENREHKVLKAFKQQTAEIEGLHEALTAFVV